MIDNTIWKSLRCAGADLLTLAHRAGEVHRFLDVARCHNHPWREYAHDAMRDFGVAVPTDRLEAFITGLRSRRIPFDTIECHSAEALAICQKFGLTAASAEPLSVSF